MKRATFVVTDELEADEVTMQEWSWTIKFAFQLSEDEFEELYHVWAHNGYYLDGHTCDWSGHLPLHDKIEHAAQMVLTDKVPDWMYCY